LEGRIIDAGFDRKASTWYRQNIGALVFGESGAPALATAMEPP
jgi:hypothetical protein